MNFYCLGSGRGRSSQGIGGGIVVMGTGRERGRATVAP